MGAIIVIVVFFALGSVFGLHFKRMLPSCFYSLFSKWRRVKTEDVEEDKHQTIIKKGGDALNASELGPMSDTAKINGDSTIVTYVAEGKEEEDVKKEVIDAADEKKDDEKEEKKDEEKKEEASEETPLKEEEEESAK